MRDSPSKPVDSDKLSVQHSVGETIPAFCQPSEDGGESSPAVQAEHTGDVLPYDPFGAKAASKETKFERQVTTLVIHTFSESGDAERLAGSSADENIDSCILPRFDSGEIAVQWHARIMMLENGTRELVDLGKERGFPAERMPRNRCSLDAATYGPVNHASSFTSVPARTLANATTLYVGGFVIDREPGTIGR